MNGQQNEREVQKRKRQLRNLGWTELWLSICCIVLASITIPMANGRVKIRYGSYYIYRYYHSITLGEGIWCSVVPIACAILGILSGGRKSNKCKLQANLALSIISAILSLALFVQEIIYSIESYNSTDAFKAILALIALMSVINFILFIMSACYTCYLMPECGCCYPQPQVIAVSAPHQQPAVMYFSPSSGQIFSTGGQTMQIATTAATGQPQVMTIPYQPSIAIGQQPTASLPSGSTQPISPTTKPPLYADLPPKPDMYKNMM